MNEQEWLTATEPQAMLQFLRDSGKASDRKLRLFAAGCCRRVPHPAKEMQNARRAIEFAERFADGLAPKSELHGRAWGNSGEAWPVTLWKAFDAAQVSGLFAAGMRAEAVTRSDEVASNAWTTAFDAAWREENFTISEARAIADATAPAEWVARRESAMAGEEEWQCRILRCLIGNPFRPSLPLEPPYWIPEVITLAQQIYDERAFDRMPDLAALLQEAGCPDADVLKHCRDGGPHAKGCYVVDGILGKV